MRRWRVGAGAAVIVMAVFVAFVALVAEERNVAFVNGEPISRVEYDQYLSVLSADGARAVAPWQVVQSLVNQKLAQREAERLGYSATDADIDQAVAGLTRGGVSVDMVSGVGGLDAFRERLRVRMLFERVKETVTHDVRVTDNDIRRYVREHAAMITNTEWEAVKAEVEPAVRRLLVDRVWSDWLAVQRSCATVQILMPDVRLQAASPVTAC